MSLAALGLAALLSSPALAQGPRRGGFGGGFGGPGAGINLLGNASVQKELKLDDSQVEKANKLAEENRAKGRDRFQELQGLSQEERGKKMQELAKESREETHKAVTEILKPEQRRRFYQIRNQVLGVAAFNEPYLQRELKLTDEQKEKIQKIESESRDQVRELVQSSAGDREGLRDKMTAHRKETLNKVLGVLGDEQKKTYQEHLGAPFEIQFERRGPQP